MVSYPAATIEIPSELYELLGKDPKQWDPQACMRVLLKYASIFLARGRHTPGMSPLRQRYGREKEFFLVPPALVTYPNAITERTRVCELRLLQPTNYASEALLLTGNADRPLFLREIRAYGRAPRIREDRPAGYDNRQYVANACTIMRAHKWLLDLFGDEPLALVSMIEDLANIYGHHVEGEREELRKDELTFQQLTFGHAVLYGAGR